jgi:hypothetical protein
MPVKAAVGPNIGMILLGLVASVVVLGGLTLMPQRLRRPIVRIITLLGGLYAALEFFWPVKPMPTPDDPTAVGNFLSPSVVPFGNYVNAIVGWTVGLGVINLCQVHGKRLMKGGSNAFNSMVFFLSMIVMTVIGILQKAHPNSVNKDLYEILFVGGLVSLDATMFSIVAFYIVSAAYRAFRIRSVEATLLLATAIIVMLGQIAVGQMLTSWIPASGVWHNIRIEEIRSWILTVPNSAVTRAISFGLGIGSLAVALRIWLGLERGSYFDS